MATVAGKQSNLENQAVTSRKPNNCSEVNNVNSMAAVEDSEDDEIDLSLGQHPAGAGALQGNETDSACEDLEDDEEEWNNEPEPMIPQTVLDLADGALSKLPPRWRNWITRMISGSCLISGFTFLVSLGPGGLIFLTYLVEYACYSETLRLGRYICGVRDEGMKKWCWTLFLTVHWIIISGDVSESVGALVPILSSVMKYSLAVGFTMYLTLVVYFVLTMKEKDYLKRYALFAWCHMCLLFFALPGHLLNLTTMHGLIWYVLPMITITMNDIAAYMFGFFVGKTPLIKLSPKKTQEGFIGGGILTVILGTLFTHCLMTKYLFCPVQVNTNFTSEAFNAIFNLDQGSKINALLSVTDCVPPPVFSPTIFQFGSWEVTYYPFVFHGFLISLFSSLLGPFGGFLASGFKRACNRKNFGSLIPGHGGVLDRCDCMFLMAVFSYVYFRTLQISGTL